MGFLQKVHSAVAKTSKTSRFPVEKENKAAAALIHTKVGGSHTIDVIHYKDAREFSYAHNKNFDSTRSSTEVSLVEVVDTHEIEIIHLAEAFNDMTLEDDDATTKSPSFSPMCYKSDLVVVLDVDQCLVYYSEEADKNENNNANTTVGNPMWKLRPGLISFLKTTMARYETHVFTAGDQFYAEPLLDVLSAVVGLPFAGRWYRAHCTHLSLTHFAKDLKATVMTGGGGGDKDRTINMARTVAVDDNVDTFVVNPSNGIPIQQWTGEGDDRCLKSLTKLLEKLEKVPDVRPVLEKKFKLKDRYDGSGQINDFLELFRIDMRMKKYGLAA